MWKEKFILNLNPICFQHRRCQVSLIPSLLHLIWISAITFQLLFLLLFRLVGTFSAEKLEGSYSNRSQLRPHLHSEPCAALHFTGNTLESPSKCLPVPVWPGLLLLLRLHVLPLGPSHAMRQPSGLLAISQTLQAWREWGDIFKVIEKRNCQPKIFKPWKLSFRNKGGIKTSPNLKKAEETHHY